MVSKLPTEGQVCGPQQVNPLNLLPAYELMQQLPGEEGGYAASQHVKEMLGLKSVDQVFEIMILMRVCPLPYFL